MRALLILTFILSVVASNAQTASPDSPSFNLNQHKSYFFKAHSFPQLQYYFAYPLSSPSPQPQFQLLPKFNHLPGMFCKIEHKIESKSKLAPRFRLGSLNYTNWMEGKGELYSRYWK